MIKAINVMKSFGQGDTAAKVLKGAHLDIQAGEMVSIMGPSGCGKSTLLHILSGIEKEDEGDIWIDGTPLHLKSEKELAAFRLENMGYIFQAYHLIPVLTALENAALPLIARGVRDSSAKVRAMEALNQVGLSDKASSYPAELSGGQNQRVAIARAIVGNPKVIWADEPTGALDRKSAEQIVGLLRILNETLNTTVVVVTHDAHVAEQTSRIIEMENGRMVPHGGRIHV